MSNGLSIIARKISAEKVIPELSRAIRNGQQSYQEALLERLNQGNKGFNAPRLKVVTK